MWEGKAEQTKSKDGEQPEAAPRPSSDELSRVVEKACVDLRKLLGTGAVIIGEHHDGALARAVICELIRTGSVKILSIEVVLPFINMLNANGSVNSSQALAETLELFCKKWELHHNPITIADLVKLAASHNVEIYFHDLPAEDVYEIDEEVAPSLATSLDDMTMNEAIAKSIEKATSYLSGPHFTAKTGLAKDLESRSNYLADRNAYANNILQSRFGQISMTAGVLVLCGSWHVDGPHRVNTLKLEKDTEATTKLPEQPLGSYSLDHLLGIAPTRVFLYESDEELRSLSPASSDLNNNNARDPNNNSNT